MDKTCWQAALHLVLKLLDGRDMYGYQIIEELACRSNNVFQMKAGTLYPFCTAWKRRDFWNPMRNTRIPHAFANITPNAEGKKFLQEKTDEWKEYSRRQQNSGRRSLL